MKLPINSELQRMTSTINYDDCHQSAAALHRLELYVKNNAAGALLGSITPQQFPRYLICCSLRNSNLATLPPGSSPLVAFYIAA
jgi:hypothetical protein